jgi:hypothetical protein
MPISVKDALKPKETDSCKKIKAFLDNSPPDQLFEASEVLAGIGITSETTLREGHKRFNLDAYRITGKPGDRVLWGNPKAIAAFRKGAQ